MPAVAEAALPREARRIPALDGVRGLAAFAVLVNHTAGFKLALGSMGVEVFFVLSGFLIGGILMDTAGTPGWVGRFYLRRTLRIWPLYYATVAIIVATDALVSHPMSAPKWLLWVFLGNLVPMYEHATRLPATLLWSLAVEEHFYLLLPPIVAWVSRRRLPIALGILTGSSIALRLYFVQAMSAWFTYHITFCRLDVLSMGVMAAWLHRYRREWLGEKSRLGEIAFLLAGVKLVSIGYDPWLEGDFFNAVIMTTLESVATAGIILALANGQLSAAARVLSSRPFVFLGGISYGLYMLHGLVREAVSELLPPAQRPEEGLAMFLIVAPLSILIAWLSARFFERPILALSMRRPTAAVVVQGA
jgi:peptidoglycan/LPS O-acetylase OafA/YrhL